MVPDPRAPEVVTLALLESGRLLPMDAEMLGCAPPGGWESAGAVEVFEAVRRPSDRWAAIEALAEAIAGRKESRCFTDRGERSRPGAAKAGAIARERYRADAEFVLVHAGLIDLVSSEEGETDGS